MKDTLTIRVLTKDDLEAMRGLLRMFGRAFEDEAHYESSPPSDDYLRTLLSSETFIAIAVFHGRNVVGGLTGYILPKFEQERSEFYIYDLAVDEQFRRQGLATKAIAELHRVTSERGVYVVYVQADLEDAPAIALYTKLGTREDVLHFDLDPTRV